VLQTVQIHLLGTACATFLWLGHGRCLRALGGSRRELFRHVARGLRNFLRDWTRAAAGRAPTASANSGGRVPVRAQESGRAR
jgi:hypothetical protein